MVRGRRRKRTEPRFVFSYANMYKAEGPDLDIEDTSSIRPCLNCRKPFKSSHKFHRICDQCKSKPDRCL